MILEKMVKNSAVVDLKATNSYSTFNMKLIGICATRPDAEAVLNDPIDDGLLQPYPKLT